jgi:hypothetical protein
VSRSTRKETKRGFKIIFQTQFGKNLRSPNGLQIKGGPSSHLQGTATAGSYPLQDQVTEADSFPQKKWQGGYRETQGMKRREKQRHTAQEGGYKLPWKVINTELGKALHMPNVRCTNASVQ